MEQKYNVVLVDDSLGSLSYTALRDHDYTGNLDNVYNPSGECDFEAVLGEVAEEIEVVSESISTQEDALRVSDVAATRGPVVETSPDVHVQVKPEKVNISEVKARIRIVTAEAPKDAKVRRFACPHCGRQFVRRWYLQMHERSHTGEKPYQCPHCPQAFAQQASLRIHIRIHTGEKPYECNICQKRFITNVCLKKHQITHSGLKPFQCTICGKCCNRKNNLKLHMQTHVKEREHKCHMCERSYTYKSKLEDHIRRHTGERPFECNVCQRRYHSKLKLYVHSKTHLNRDFKCDICKRHFINKSKFERHYNNHSTPKRTQKCKKEIPEIVFDLDPFEFFLPELV